MVDDCEISSYIQLPVYRPQGVIHTGNYRHERNVTGDGTGAYRRERNVGYGMIQFSA